MAVKSLNSEQEKAVVTTNGRILVLAGAGSGKTSVLIQRISRLIEGGCPPSAILGLTFTNKAAEEMRERIAKSIGKKKSQDIMLSTFHSFCFFVLKKEIHNLGFSREFTIYDERDMTRLTTMVERSFEEEVSEEKLKAEILKSLKAYNAVNFDTLLSLTVELFKLHPEVLATYQDRFQYIMIDEYQDTNEVQFELAELLAQKSGNLFVVGDDDQSIYSWRGAKIQNILGFQSSIKVKLEQNYRSTKQILDVANRVIAKNTNRHEKTLWSNKVSGDEVHLFHAPNETLEADAVVERICRLKRQKNLRWKDFAILYRSNSLSRPFETALLKACYKDGDKFLRGIPYQVIQGTEFYERAEVKDFLAYLKAIVNPKDQTALLRIINYPRRGVSVKTIEKLQSIAKKESRSIWEIIQNTDSLDLTTHAHKGLQYFVELMKEAKKKFSSGNLKEGMRYLIEKLEFKRVIADEVKSEKAREFKWSNVEMLVSMVDQFGEEGGSLSDFLGTTLLDQNRNNKSEFSNDRVNLLTFHSAKGLEFPACFLVALEDRFLPHEKSLMEGNLEEERRLFYVALTRAKKYLTLSMGQKRTLHGKEKPTNPSRFLFEIPKELLLIEHWDFPKDFMQ